MVGKGLIITASLPHFTRFLIGSLAFADCKMAVRILTRVANGTIFAKWFSEKRIPLVQNGG